MRFPFALAMLAAAAAIALPLATHAHEGDAPNKRPVKAVADQRFGVTTQAGSGALPLYVSRDWNAPQPNVTRVLLVFHGRLRDADLYYRSAQNALAAAVKADPATAENTLLVVPQFLAEADVPAHRLAEDTLRWDWENWEGGEAARAPAPISSFEAVDAILLRLADRRLFPALKTVILAGHSGGAQVVQRYAVVGRGEALLADSGLKLRYVVANPSSYLYFSPERPGSDGNFTVPQDNACANFNQWKYGWDDAPPYAARAAPAEYERGYARRDVIYLLGTADVDPMHPALDKSCAGRLEGPYRFARGLAYARYVRQRNPDTAQRLWLVEGVGHHADRMLTSACGLAALFDIGVCPAK